MSTPLAATSNNALYSKWADPYYSGQIKSNTGEVWSYDRGNVKANEGPAKGASYSWNGSDFIPAQNKEHPIGHFDGQTLTWKYPSQSDLFYTYTLNESQKEIKNVSGLSRTQPTRYTSFVHWKYDGPKITIIEGSDYKEGEATYWELGGDYPLPVALFTAMFSRSQKLLEDAISRSKRVYKRCGVGVLARTCPPLLCAVCAPPSDRQDHCAVCDKECSSQKFEGMLCKKCTTRKNFCVKCGDPVKNYQREGFLCSDCGLGKAANNCCKMLYN